MLKLVKWFDEISDRNFVLTDSEFDLENSSSEPSEHAYSCNSEQSNNDIITSSSLNETV